MYEIINNLYNAYQWECDIALASLLGAIIGLERELRGKAAGIRTYAIICMASCLFTILSKSVGNDPARIAANILTGVGFLGAGIIWHQKDGSTEGLTTAASVWCISALGMSIGFGFISIAITSAITILIIMELFGLMYKFFARFLKLKILK